MSDFRIIFTNDEGGVSVVVPAPGISPEEAVRAVPTGKQYEVVPLSEIPTDRTFRGAWKRNGKKCEVDVTKAKEICHCKRRDKRTEELAPHDEVIMKQIPGKSAQQAELERQKIRDKHAIIQSNIDAATTVEQLKQIIGSL